MDKSKNSGTPTPALVVKLVLVLVFLLTAAFVSGVMIGKNGRRNIDRTSSDEEGINEKLSNCIFIHKPFFTRRSPEFQVFFAKLVRVENAV